MKSPIILHSALAPVVAVDALRRSIDEERRTLFSLSGYRGSRPVLGKVTGSTFHIQKRRYWRNDFAPCLYGQFQTQAGGSRIEAGFDTSVWTNTFMRIWRWGAGLLGTPIFVLSALDFLTGSHHTTGDTRLGLIAPPALVLWGFLLPRIGRFLSQSDEGFLLDFVLQTLAERVEDPVGTMG